MDKNKENSILPAVAAAIKNSGLKAGCAELFMEQLQGAAETGSQIKVLKRLRLELLEEIHGKQKALDLIDYIIYKLKQGTL